MELEVWIQTNRKDFYFEAFVRAAKDHYSYKELLASTLAFVVPALPQQELLLWAFGCFQGKRPTFVDFPAMQYTVRQLQPVDNGEGAPTWYTIEFKLTVQAKLRSTLLELMQTADDFAIYSPGAPSKVDEQNCYVWQSAPWYIGFNVFEGYPQIVGSINSPELLQKLMQRLIDWGRTNSHEVLFLEY